MLLAEATANNPSFGRAWVNADTTPLTWGQILTGSFSLQYWLRNTDAPGGRVTQTGQISTLSATWQNLLIP